MTSYMEGLNRKEMISKARKRLLHFSDLYKLLGARYKVNAVTYDEQHMQNGYSNHAQKLLTQIEKNDERFEEIEIVMNAMELLDDEEAECLYLRHIAFSSVGQIGEILGKSRSATYTIMNEAYFKIAIILYGK